MNVEKTVNKDLEYIDIMKKHPAPVVIWGSEQGGIPANIGQRLKEAGISKILFAPGKQWYRGADNEILDFEVDKKLAEYYLCPGFYQSYLISDTEIKSKFSHAIGIYRISDVWEGIPEKICAEFFEKNQEAFEEVYKNLSDDKSRKSMCAFLNAKINRNYEYLVPHVAPLQYFCGHDTWFPIDDNEYFVNCGAYNGDTIESYAKTTGGRWGKVWAIEPEYHNILAINKLLKENAYNNVEIVPCGVFSEKQFLRFGGGILDLFRANDNGDHRIPVDTIDNIVNENKVTLINMDVEGSELAALHGANKTIRRNKPKLAISAYHKKDDIFELYRYIKELVPEYRFYFRIHKHLPTDAILYAIA